MRRIIFFILANVLLTCNSWAAVKEQHPRLYLTNARMVTMQAAAKANTHQWQRLIDFVNGAYYSTLNENIMNNALAYKIKDANGDADADTYRDAAISYVFDAVESGVITSTDAHSLTETTKDWIDESSKWMSDTLGIYKYYGINPDITQDKVFMMNVGYGADKAHTDHTDTQFFIHPSPSTSLLLDMYSDRSEFDAVADVGDTYVVFPSNPDYTKDRALGVALAFDWLYDDLTSQQKDIIVAWLYGCAKYMMTDDNFGTENYSWGNYPLNYLSDLSAIAYAIYGYDTTKANKILAYIQNVYDLGIKTSLKWTLQNGGWLEGDGYGASILHRFTEFLDHGLTAEGIDRWVDFSDELKGRLLYGMHMTLPTLKTGFGGVPYREIIANGDGSREWAAVADYLRKSSLMIIAHYPNEDISKQAQTFFSTDTDKQIYAYNSGWELLFYNPSQATLSLSTAPLQNAAMNIGMVQMRSGWNSDATHATFKCGPKLSYHSHLDATAFTIFKYSDLAPDTGTYPGSGGSVHAVNYFARTIAHNALLLYDSTEASWEGAFQGNTYSARANDGGQRNLDTFTATGERDKHGSWQTSGYDTGRYKYQGSEDIYEMGKITKYDKGEDFVYTIGDATSGYNGSTHKASQVLRKFLYVRPDLFVVYDKVISKDTSIVPKFVLHSVNTLSVNGTPKEIASNAEYHYSDGNTLTLDNGKGRLFSKTLLPIFPVIEKIGGRGLRDFWVEGANYPAGSNEYGLWRAEITSPTPSVYTEFLTALYATSTTTPTMPASKLFESTDGQMKGVQVNAPEATYAILFSSAQNDTAPTKEISYSTDKAADKHLVFDLMADTLYYVLIDGATVTISKTEMAGGNQITSSHAGTLQLGSKKESLSPTITHISITP